MSKRCELQKDYFQKRGNYKGKGKYSDDYVKWLEDKILARQQVKKFDLADVVGSEKRTELVCGFCGTNKAEVCFKCHTNECVSAAGQN